MHLHLTPRHCTLDLVLRLRPCEVVYLCKSFTIDWNIGDARAGTKFQVSSNRHLDPLVERTDPCPARHSYSSMFDALRRRSIAARSATTGMTQPEETLAALAALPPPGGLKPYDKPCADGKCYLSFLPGEVLTRIFLNLDRASLTKCYRVGVMSDPDQRGYSPR